MARFYHFDRPRDEVIADATELARLFGLPGLPAGRRETTPMRALVRAACVRGFLGSPDLIVVHDQLLDETSDLAVPMAQAISAARDRGATVLWITASLAAPAARFVQADHLFRLGDQRLVRRGGRDEALDLRRLPAQRDRRRRGARLHRRVHRRARSMPACSRTGSSRRFTCASCCPTKACRALAPGAEVQVLGTRAGEIRRIVIDPNQRMHAVARVEDQMRPFIRRDSKVSIRRQFGVAGAAFIDISRGTGPELDWSYAVIAATTDRAATDTLGQMVDECAPRSRRCSTTSRAR